MDSPVWVVLDIVVTLFVAIAMITFFARRNSYRIAILSVIYGIIYIAVLILNQYYNNVGYIAVRVLSFFNIFWIVAIVVVYSSDLKIFMSKIARRQKVKYDYATTDDQLLQSAREIVKACQNMAKNDVGALIIIAPTEIPAHILDTGTSLDATISCGLLESIFNTKAPLHDGAVVVLGARIISAGCFLPLSQEVTLAKDLGTRHRAAIGITEESDVFAIVVSEESGIISVVQGGAIKRYMTPEKLLEEIKVVYRISSAVGKKKKKK
ncbi:MAG: DNA integrity scanning protein DisA nucleotide-binding domain protein [Clostridia bacterium]|nr:DNA integrity scanning protein DisA nucleotide-binding domain protein [Clostridia bacterium]MDE7328296.1 DNA integrity scanning protein DisA nucleotide-binding domain protein [Clostridia bacterium]